MYFTYFHNFIYMGTGHLTKYELGFGVRITLLIKHALMLIFKIIIINQKLS